MAPPLPAASSMIKLPPWQSHCVTRLALSPAGCQALSTLPWILTWNKTHRSLLQVFVHFLPQWSVKGKWWSKWWNTKGNTLNIYVAGEMEEMTLKVTTQVSHCANCFLRVWTCWLYGHILLSVATVLRGSVPSARKSTRFWSRPQNSSHLVARREDNECNYSET